MNRLSFLFWSISASLSAFQPEQITRIVASYPSKEKTSLCLCSNGTHWQIYSFQKRWRSPLEWWNGVQLVPEEYEVNVSDWSLGTEVLVYPKSWYFYDHMGIDETNASNQEDLKKCFYVFVHAGTQQVVFAEKLNGEEFTYRIFLYAHDKGYEEGFLAGSREGHTIAAARELRAKEEGYLQGKTEGYREGKAAGVREGATRRYQEPVKPIPPEDTER